MLTPLPPAIVRCSTVRWRLPEAEVRHRERLVDRRVERDRDDHPGSLLHLPARPDGRSCPRAARTQASGPAERRRPGASRTSPQAASRRRSASARAAAAGSPPPAQVGAGDAARRRDQAARAPGGECCAQGPRRGPPARRRRGAGRWRCGISSRARSRCAGSVAPTTAPTSLSPEAPTPGRAELVDERRKSLPHRAAALQLADPRRPPRPGWMSARAPARPPARPRGRHERLDRIPCPSAG